MIEQYWSLQGNIMQSRSWVYSNYKWQRSHQTTYTYTVHLPKTQININKPPWKVMVGRPLLLSLLDWVFYSTTPSSHIFGEKNHHLFRARIFPRNGASCGCWLSKYKRAILSSTAIWPDRVCHWRFFLESRQFWNRFLGEGWLMGEGRQAISNIYKRL